MQRTFGPPSGIHGYWGDSTSTIDWCEQNYVYTHYIAEFWNTLSSLSISFWSLIGIVLLLRNNFEWRFLLIHIITIIVGVGSALFHGTLLISGQMWDEVPMLWFIISLGYILLQLNIDGNRLFTILGCVFYASLCSVVHYLGAYVLAFQAHFAFLIVLCSYKLRTITLKEKSIAAYTYFPRAARIILIFSVAFWLADQFFCETFLVSFNPQGHAIWHLLNSLAIHFGVQYTLAMRLKYKGIDPEVKFYFGAPFILPKFVGKKLRDGDEKSNID